MSDKPITNEDIYAKLGELIALQWDSYKEIIHIANATASTQIMLNELSKHLGLPWEDDDEEEEDEEKKH